MAMSNELKTLLKRLTIEVVDALGLWRDSSGALTEPTWAQKELTITNYLSDPNSLDVLIGLAHKILDDNPDMATFRYVTRAFIISTLGLLEDYRLNEFPPLIVKPGEGAGAAEAAPEDVGEKEDAGDDHETK